MDIPNDAVLCHVCKKYQVGWRNWVAVVSGGVALITLVFSGLVYIGKFIGDFYRDERASDRIEVAYFSAPGAAGYINAGDKDVFFLSDEVSCQWKSEDGGGWLLGEARGIYERVSPNNLAKVRGQEVGVAFGSDTVVNLDGGVFPEQLQYFRKEDAEKDKLISEMNFPRLPALCAVNYYSFLENANKRHEFDCECMVFPRLDAGGSF